MAKAKKPAAKKSASTSEKGKEKDEKKAAAKKSGKDKSIPATNGKAKEEEKPAETTGTKKVTITKIKRDKKNQLIIDSIKIEADGSTTTPHEPHKDRTAHPDLIEKFDDLRVHFALMTEQVSTTALKDIYSYNPTMVEKFIVRGVTITTGDNEGIILSGAKILKSGKFFNFNTPLYLIEEQEATRYRHMDALMNTVDELIEETKQYQSGEKVGEAKQPELPFDDAGDAGGDGAGEEENATADENTQQAE